MVYVLIPWLQDIGIGSLVMADGPAGLRLARHFVRGADGAHSLGSPVPESMLEYLPGAARWASRLTAKGQWLMR